VIQVVNKRDKVLLVSRRDEEIPVNPASVFDLQHEDDVVVSNNVVVSCVTRSMMLVHDTERVKG
jgi:hypothetical protein